MRDYTIKENVDLTLTIANLIVGVGGWTIFEKGQRVKAYQVIKQQGHYYHGFSYWVPEVITGYKIEGHETSIWSPDTFEK